MSLHDHSSVTITIEVPDFDNLRRQFQTGFSHLLRRAPPSAGCAGRQCSDLESAMMAVAHPATTECLRQKGGRPLCASSRAGPQQTTSSGWFSELLLGVPLSGHRSESAADALCCLPPACHRRRGLEIRPDLHSFSCRFHSLAYSIAYSVLPYHIFFVVYSRGPISHMCYIACHVTTFLWYMAHDR